MTQTLFSPEARCKRLDTVGRVSSVLLKSSVSLDYFLVSNMVYAC
jgi:hypothetical protein